jgi:hypothetical protein
VLPVHISAASQTPAELRQVVVAGANASAGQTVEAPVQSSAVSQAPAEARHTAPALPGPVATHTGAPLAQLTVPTSQGLPVLQAAPGVQPIEHMPPPLQKPPEHARPVG